MKKEFNFQSVNQASAASRAFLIALPALFANVAAYGWPGLFVLSAITAGMMVRANQNLDYSIDIRQRRRKLNGDADDLEHLLKKISAKLDQIDPRRAEKDEWPVKPETREQRMSRLLSPSFGLPVIAVKADALDGRPFGTDMMHIVIDPVAAKRLSDNEMEFVIAHELDHIRMERDFYALTPIDSFRKASVLAGAVTCIAPILSVSGPLPSAVAGGTAALVSYLSMHTANASIWRDVESRCDANALRATGDLDAAKGALTKIYDIVRERQKGTPFEHINAHPFQRHPGLKNRLANLERTWNAMQKEAQQISVPATP